MRFKVGDTVKFITNGSEWEGEVAECFEDTEMYRVVSVRNARDRSQRGTLGSVNVAEGNLTRGGATFLTE